jgi:hypothetical protein
MKIKTIHVEKDVIIDLTPKKKSKLAEINEKIIN